jgi:hypothetical protein
LTLSGHFPDSLTEVFRPRVSWKLETGGVDSML